MYARKGMDKVKIIAAFLFASQLFFILQFGFLYFRNIDFYEIFLENRTLLLLNFDNFENFEFFLEFMEEKELVVSKHTRTNSEILTIYTTEVILESRISLLEGTWPAEGSTEIISTYETMEAEQVGLFTNVVHGTNIILSHLNHHQDFGLDGFYFISTTDPELLETIVNTLVSRIPLVYVFDDTPEWRVSRVIQSIHVQDEVIDFASSTLQIRELIFILPVLTLCLLASLIQYAVVRVKRMMILSIHGYDKKKVLRETTLDMGKSLLGSAIIIFVFAIISTLIINRMILTHLIRYFLMMSAILIVNYLVLVNVTMLILWRYSSISETLKGKKLKMGIQTLNHTIKFIFVGFCLFQFVDIIHGLKDYLPRVEAMPYWEQVKNVHRVVVGNHTLSDFGHMDDEKLAFYYDMILHHRAFIMDASIISAAEMSTEDTWREEVRFDYQNNEIIINPNFLVFNPIYDLNDNPVYDKLIFDDFVLNIILPERFWYMSEEIEADILNSFRGWIASYAINNEQTICNDDASINVIRVPDGQYYLLFDPFLRVESGHRTRDPIAIIYYGRFSDLFLPSALTHSFYFYSGSDDPFLEIEELVYYHGLEAQIQRVESVYHRHVNWMQAIEEHYWRLIGSVLLLVISNVVVTFNLVVNYFERYKFDIFLKSTFGWHPFKQNKVFLITYLSYSMLLAILMSLRLGWYALIVGVTVLIFDVTTMLLFQRRLLKKSFSEIMKGER